MSEQGPPAESPAGVVGWIVALDAATFGLRCAPTASAARVLWGAPERDERVRVAPVDLAFAIEHDAECRNCRRPLAEG